MSQQVESTSHKELNILGNVVATLMSSNIKLIQELDHLERKHNETIRKLGTTQEQLRDCEKNLRKVEEDHKMAKEELGDTEKTLQQTLKELQWVESQLDVQVRQELQEDEKLRSGRRTKKDELILQKEIEVAIKLMNLEQGANKKDELIMQLLKWSKFLLRTHPQNRKYYIM